MHKALHKALCFVLNACYKAFKKSKKGKKNTMENNYEKIVFTIASQNENTQEEIMQALKNQFTEEEYKVILIGVSYFRMLNNEKLKEAMKDAICKQLYFEFTGKELDI